MHVEVGERARERARDRAHLAGLQVVLRAEREEIALANAVEHAGLHELGRCRREVAVLEVRADHGVVAHLEADRRAREVRHDRAVVGHEVAVFEEVVRRAAERERIGELPARVAVRVAAPLRKLGAERVERGNRRLRPAQARERIRLIHRLRREVVVALVEHETHVELEPVDGLPRARAAALCLESLLDAEIRGGSRRGAFEVLVVHGQRAGIERIPAVPQRSVRLDDVPHAVEVEEPALHVVVDAHEAHRAAHAAVGLKAHAVDVGGVLRELVHRVARGLARDERRDGDPVVRHRDRKFLPRVEARDGVVGVARGVVRLIDRRLRADDAAPRAGRNAELRWSARRRAKAHQAGGPVLRPGEPLERHVAESAVRELRKLVDRVAAAREQIRVRDEVVEVVLHQQRERTVRARALERDARLVLAAVVEVALAPRGHEGLVGDVRELRFHRGRRAERRLPLAVDDAARARVDRHELAGTRAVVAAGVVEAVQLELALAERVVELEGRADGRATLAETVDLQRGIRAFDRRHAGERRKIPRASELDAAVLVVACLERAHGETLDATFVARKREDAVSARFERSILRIDVDAAAFDVGLLGDRHAIDADREVRREELAGRHGRALGGPLVGGDLAELCCAHVDREIAALAVVSAENGIDDRRAVGLEVVVDLCAAEGVLAVARLDGAFEVDALDGRCVERSSAGLERRKRVVLEEDHAAFRGQQKRAVGGCGRRAVLDLDGALDADAVGLLVGDDRVCAEGDGSGRLEDGGGAAGEFGDGDRIGEGDLVRSRGEAPSGDRHDIGRLGDGVDRGARLRPLGAGGDRRSQAAEVTGQACLTSGEELSARGLRGRVVADGSGGRWRLCLGRRVALGDGERKFSGAADCGGDQQVLAARTETCAAGWLVGAIEPDGDLRDSGALVRKSVDPDRGALGAEGVAAERDAHVALEEQALCVVGLPDPSARCADLAVARDRLGREHEAAEGRAVDGATGGAWLRGCRPSHGLDCIGGCGCGGFGLRRCVLGRGDR